MAFLVKSLDRTVRQGARSYEGQYYEARKKETGVVLKQKYRPEGKTFKGVKNMTDGQGRRGTGEKVSWKKGTGGEKMRKEVTKK